MIAFSAFNLLILNLAIKNPYGFSPFVQTVGFVAAVIGIYFVSAVAAVILNRGALLIGALFCVLAASGAFYEIARALADGLVFTLLGVVGASQILLSLSWHRVRLAVLAYLPNSLRARLPAI